MKTVGLKKRTLPFRLNLRLKTSRTEQLTAGLRQAILCGRFRPGSNLPTLREIVKETGVSLIVAREAVNRLSKEGLVNPRRGIGITVVGAAKRCWQGHVLWVIPDRDDNYQVNMMGGVFRECLGKAGYLVSQVTMMRGTTGRYDFSRLDVVLGQSVDLVVLVFTEPEIDRYLSRKGVPFLRVNAVARSLRGCVGEIAFSHDAPVGDFVSHCRRTGVHRILQVGYEPTSVSAVQACRAAGLEIEEWTISPLHGCGRLEAVERAALEAFQSRLTEGRCGWLPDLIFFVDDIVADGAMKALVRSGVRIPEDVKVVSWANRGRGPVFFMPLSRLEMDPQESGETIVRAARSYLSGARIAQGLAIGAVWHRGETA